MAISYIADASWNSGGSSSSSFTLQKPSGTASGDYMVAIVALDTFDGGGGNRTFTPPSGWTSQGHVYSGPNCVIDVMTRAAGSSEPSSWSGSFSGGSTPDRVSIVTTYRGVAGLAVDGTSSTGSGTSFSTATVNNPTATNWRVVAAAYASASVSYNITSNEVINRDTEPQSNVYGGMWDSNGTIGTGNTSRTVSRGAAWESAAAWIGILDASDGSVASGTLGISLPLLTVSNTASLSYSGTMAGNLPKPTMTADGIATPPAGPLDVLVLPTMTATMFTDASGTLGVMAGPIVEITAETRAFGIRVVTPARESRVTTPLRGATD